MNQIDIALANYKPISQYIPKTGDFVVWHGWITHYYGVINAFNDNSINIIKSGMPSLLFTMDPAEMDKNSLKVSLSKIRKSRGAYAILQNGIWYV